jgi:hypothetical protein
MFSNILQRRKMEIESGQAHMAHYKSAIFYLKKHPLTGRPTDILKQEMVLLPAQSFTSSVYVNFGLSTLPYTVPANELESALKIIFLFFSHVCVRERGRERLWIIFIYLLIVH